jgi:hypothetical protein
MGRAILPSKNNTISRRRSEKLHQKLANKQFHKCIAVGRGPLASTTGSGAAVTSR